MLRQRVITAVVLAALLLLGIFFLPATALSMFFAVVVLAGAWEWSQLAGIEQRLLRAGYVATIAAIMLGVTLWCDLFSLTPRFTAIRDLLGLACTWWALALLWVKTYPGSAALWGSRAMRAVMGAVTLAPAWLALVVLRLHSYGEYWLLLLILVVASADIGAYFAGRAWGRSKLAPNVSPGKSWAGFWGGVTAAGVLSSLLWWWLGQSLPYAGVLAVTLVTIVGSVLGDLLESMVKRHRGVKDSGQLLPGHGGILDRVDSLTAAAPVFALSIMLAGW